MSLPDVKLPNVRSLFLPDPGHILIDCDLSGADAQVVAWDANDDDLKHAFKSGLNVHNHNGAAIWGEAYSPEGKRPGARFTMRDECKRAVHGTNYGGAPRTIAITLGWTIAFAEQFQRRWLKELHPAIGEWHARTEHDINTKKSVSNAFGYRIVYFDRPSNLLPKALAWKPQSTIAIVASRGAVRVHENIPWCQVLLQVHDSVVMQIPTHRYTPASLEIIHRHLDVEVPYPDPLVIPWDLATSEKSWGHCKKVKWDLSDAA